jgi:hypothetical protein
VQNFAVGDQLMFWNKEYQGNRTDAWAQTTVVYPILYNSITGVFTGDATDANTVGGLTEYYTITAMSGSVVTLDRAPAYDNLFVGTTVMKVNRGGINFTGGARNRTGVYQFGNSNTWYIENMNLYNASNAAGVIGLQQAQNNTGYGANIRNVTEDVFTYSPQRSSNTIVMSGDRMRNIIGRISRYPGQANSPFVDMTGIAFNIFNETGVSRGYSIQKLNKVVHNHIVELRSTPNISIYSDFNVVTPPLSHSNRRGKWYIKNNYWHTNINDPRAIDLQTLRSISEQANKSFVWSNNFYNGGMITGYALTTNGNDAPSLYSQFELTDYRNLYSAAPMPPRKGFAQQVSKNVHGTYNLTTVYTHNWFNGFIDTTRLRMDKSKYIRMSLATSITSFIFDESGYYSLWTDNAAYSNSALGNFLTCTFNLKQDAAVRIQLNMQARVNLARKHAIGILNNSSGNTGQNYTYYGMDLPKVLIVDLNTSLVLFSKLITSADWQDASINQTYSLAAGDYAIVFEPGRQGAELAQVFTAQHILDYTEPTLNILTPNINDVDVYINNWDNYKLLRNTTNNIVSDIYYKDNIGAATVARTSTNLTTTTRFNKVKL